MPSEATNLAAAPSRRNNIGTLRMVGALVVLLGHSFILSSQDGQTRDAVSQAIADVAPFGLGLPGVGLALFFAISGYLVAQSFQRRGNALAYVEARLLRIYPALFVAIGLTIAMGAIVSTFPPDPFLSSKKTVAYAVGGASLLDVHYLLPGVFESNPRPSVNGSLWTLPVEMKLYLFVLVAGVAGLLGRRRAFNIAVAVLIAWAAIWPEHLPIMGHQDHREIATFFLAGSVLFVNRDWLQLRGVGVIALAVLAAAMSWTAAYPLLFALAVAYAVLWLGFTDRIRLPDLAAGGDLSYGTYLFAFPASQMWVMALGPGSPWLVALLTAAVVLPMAYCCWRLVEAPALRLKGRLVPPKLTRRSVIVPTSE